MGRSMLRVHSAWLDSPGYLGNPLIWTNDQTDGVTSSASPAVDFAPATSGDDHTDLDGRPRDVDVTFLVDRFGPRDLGAYEMQPITDRIYVNGFGDRYQLVY